MKQRISIDTLEPEAFKAMMAFENSVSKTPLNLRLKELIKIRASQLNGCAYCIDMHTTQARKSGETDSRMFALSAWRESPLFSDEERAILAMTEEVTLISEAGLTDQTYETLKTFFDDNTIAQAIMQVVTINAWNRIAVASHKVHDYQIRVKLSHNGL